MINEALDTYYSSSIRPDTKWGSKKNEGNGIVSQETNKETSRKGWKKRFFFEDNPNYFVVLFVWGYYFFAYKNGEYKEIEKEEFKRNVRNANALESLAKKELVTIVDKQTNRHEPIIRKEDTAVKDALNKAYEETLPKNMKAITTIERTKNGTDFPLNILVKFFENGKLVSSRKMSYNRNKKRYEVYAGRDNGSMEISKKDIEDITTEVVRKSGSKIAKHMYFEEANYFPY